MQLRVIWNRPTSLDDGVIEFHGGPMHGAKLDVRTVEGTVIQPWTLHQKIAEMNGMLSHRPGQSTFKGSPVELYRAVCRQYERLTTQR